MKKKEILLLCGGGRNEHEISLRSADYIKSQLDKIDSLNTHYITMLKNGDRIAPQGQLVELRKSGEIYYKDSDKTISLDFAIPCLHGHPGETGEIPALFALMGLPFLGANHEASVICFNKISTKLWLDALGILNTPYVFLENSSPDSIKKALDFFDQYQDVFIKPATEGSSVGCFHVNHRNEVKNKIKEANKYSSYILVEKNMKARELEVAVYEYDGKIHASPPGEICCPSQFYSYEEKYNQDSKTTIQVIAPDIHKDLSNQIRHIAIRAFEGLKIRHLARIDFFLDSENQIYLNEVNTFPGHTKTSMFPMMMEHYGHDYSLFLKYIINNVNQ